MGGQITDLSLSPWGFVICLSHLMSQQITKPFTSPIKFIYNNNLEIKLTHPEACIEIAQ
jgi:hypothetical protein